MPQTSLEHHTIENINLRIAVNALTIDWLIFYSVAEFVTVTLALRFINVTVAETEFTFYNCSLVQELSGRRPWVHVF